MVEPLRRFPSGAVRAAFALTAIMALYAATEVSGQNMAGPPEPRVIAAASPILQTLLVNAERDQSFWDASELRKFYEQRAYRLAWADEQGAEERRAIAIRALEGAWEDGLVSQDYRRGLTSTEPVSQLPEAAVAARDLALTDNFLRYMHDMRNGRIEPEAAYRTIELPPHRFDAVAALTDALADGDLESLIAELPPPHAQYAHLKAELARYRQLQVQGGWPQLPAHSEIVLSQDEPRLELLRRRLAIEDSELVVREELPTH